MEPAPPTWYLGRDAPTSQWWNRQGAEIRRAAWARAEGQMYRERSTRASVLVDLHP